MTKNFERHFRSCRVVDLKLPNIRVDTARKEMFISQTTNSLFANYRFSFCKLHIFISQTSDFLGPILFVLYTSPIGNIVRSYDINFHLYTDDSQLYITFSTSSMSQLENAKSTLEAAVTEIDKWMLQNSLKIR